MNVWGRMKVVWADILQVSVASPSSGMGFMGGVRRNRCLLTDDPDGCLDYEGHQKAVISYSWLTDEEMAERVGGVLEGCCSVAGLCLIAMRWC